MCTKAAREVDSYGDVYGPRVYNSLRVLEGSPAAIQLPGINYASITVAYNKFRLLFIRSSALVSFLTIHQQSRWR